MKKWILMLTVIFILFVLMVASCSTSNTTAISPTQPVSTTQTTSVSTNTYTSPMASSPIQTTTQIASNTATPNRGGILKIGVASSEQAFGYPPLIAFGAHYAAQPAIEYLLDFNINGVPRARLAKDFKIGDNGKSFTIFLREGVKFHDGTDCDAEAVKWNMEQFAIAKVPMLTSVSSIDIVDKWTVRLNLNAFSNALIYDLVLSGGMVISPTAAKQNGIEWTYTHPVGTGPFKFESFQRGVSLKYIRNEDYWDKGKPYLDGIEFHYISDSVTREMALKSGQLDALTSYDVSSHASLKAAGYNMKKVPFGVFGLYPDSKNPDSPFAIKEVREAVEYAIDRPAIAEALGYGIWEPADQEADTHRSSYCPDLNTRSYDPAKAKTLLTQAGYPNGFNTTILAQNVWNKDLLGSMQNYLAAVGIKAEIELLDMGKWNDYYFNGWHNGLAFYFTPSEPRTFDAFNRSFAPESNYAVSVFKPAEIGELLKKGDIETDPVRLNEYVQGVVRLLHENALTIPVIINYMVGVESPKLKDSGMMDESRTFKVHSTWADAYFIK